MGRSLQKIVLFIVLTSLLLGERPKIGLVLSGGGGKGFAHIGVLRVLEREQIPIDYISGTSIGSIIGFLYSIGYSVDELEEIVDEIDWENIFIDNPERLDRPMEEKIFSERYALSLPIKDYKVKLPMGLISGQKVYMTLKKYAWDARSVRDFNNFPIPFRAVATDLSTGQPVVLDSGDIVRALNASMAIPSFFRPVKWEEKILSDGLSSTNFPVDQVREMGADIVIGVDIGAPLSDVDDLSFLGVLNQVQAFRGRDNTLEQREKVDYLIEPNISIYSPIDFQKKEELIALGEKAANEGIAELSKLSNREAFAERGSLLVDNDLDSRAHINSVELKGLEKVEDTFIYGFLDKSIPFTIDENQLDDIVKRMYALGFFDRIYYEVISDKLIFVFEEKSEEYLNIGVNYSSLDGVNNASIILGTSLNSFGMAGSKTTADLVVSQYPKFKATNFLYYGMGAFKKIGLISTFQYDRDISYNYNKDGIMESESKYNEMTFDLFAGSILGKRTITGFGLTYDMTNYESTNLLEDKEEVISFYFKSTYDSFNKASYPTKGSYLSFVSRNSPESFNNRNNFEFSTAEFVGTRYMELNQNLALHATLGVESTLGKNAPEKYQSVLEGVNYEGNLLSFYGMPSGGQQVKTYVLLKFGLQYEVFKKLYMQFVSNSASFEDLNGEIGVYSGYGIGLGYDSILGPVDFVITNDAVEDEGLLFHFNLGYKF